MLDSWAYFTLSLIGVTFRLFSECALGNQSVHLRGFKYALSYFGWIGLSGIAFFMLGSKAGWFSWNP
jgi:hypothetical protein